MTKDARIARRANIELTRQNFHWLIRSMSEAALAQPSKDPAWTNGELLMQMCMAPRVMMSNLSHAVDGSWIYPPVLKLFPKALRSKLNKTYIRSTARTATHLSFIIEFDKTCLFALKLLEEMWEQDLETPLIISNGDGLLSGKVTVKDVFDYLPSYYDIHSQQLNFVRRKELENGLPNFMEEPGKVRSISH